MKEGKHEVKKVKLIEKYTVLLLIATLFISIGYANIIDQELTITGTTTAEAQDEVFITEVTTTDENSVVNYYIGTMLDSTTVVFGKEPVTYQITLHNNADREYVYIGALTDGTDETLYSNSSIEYTVNGITEGETTIAPGADLIFTITFEYTGSVITGGANTLNSKINFRFREKPILELSNENTTYTLQNIKVGHVEEYEFTVSNYNQNYTNGIPMTYTLGTTITSGSPLVAKIYNSSGIEVTGNISIGGGTPVDHTYKLKLTWDSRLDSTEYEGKNYTCKVNLVATPTDTAYADYSIKKGSGVNITTCAHNYIDGICAICGKVCTHSYEAWETEIEATCTEVGIQKRTCTVCGEETTRTTGYSRNHNFVDEICTICGLNYPQMTSDMEPVAWKADGTEFTPTTDEDWFDYLKQLEGADGTSNWANAKTSDGSYWVWVPRYEYKVTSTTSDAASAETIDVRFIPPTTNSTTSGYTTTSAVNQTVNGVEVLSKGITVSSDGYIIHPAFISTPSIGGWSSELAGIWVAKYEISMETNGVATETSEASIGNVAISDTVKAVSKPGVTSWRYINISNCYENALAYDSSKNSHLMKNSEWGAVAYLTHSQYGRNGKEVTKNSNNYTAGGSGAKATTNVAQSSTGNAYGVFDLSGSAYEYVAAFNDKYSSTGSNYSKTNSGSKSASGNNMGATGLANGGSTKYLTAYRNDTAQYYIGQSSGNKYTSYTDFAANGYTVSITGDAIYEVWVSSDRAWFSDYSRFVISSIPFFLRGGCSSNSTQAGVFYSANGDGGCYNNCSFRVCMVITEMQDNCTHSYSDWEIVKAATCSEEGTQKKICTICGRTEIQEIPATENHLYGSWEITTAATCTTAGQRKKTCLYCTASQTETIAALGHNYVNGVCSRCGAQSSLPVTNHYVGCYADLEGDGIVDGVIFVDQGYGPVGDGIWATDTWGTYTIPKITSGLKNYYVSQESYTDDFGTKAVISPVQGTTGIDRFYVMRLDDFENKLFYWYQNVNLLDDIVETDEDDFGEGYTKTGEMIDRWNNETYGSQGDRDIWKHIQEEYNEGWFILSKAEWAAVGGEFETALEPALSTSNYSSVYGLYKTYWSASQRNSTLVYVAEFDGDGIAHTRPGTSPSGRVRLCTTF